jgi:hypothetical protein
MDNSLTGCLNNYSKTELYELFGTSEKELETCMKCPNGTVVDGGVVTCKYFNEGDKNDS